MLIHDPPILGSLDNDHFNRDSGTNLQAPLFLNAAKDIQSTLAVSL